MSNSEIKKMKLGTDDNINSNIEKIRELFPNAVIEKNNKYIIDFELLKQELLESIIEDGEKYQLNWIGKKEAVKEADNPTNKTLIPIREKSVDFDNTKNIYIEGNNLDVLKLLKESYLSKIKVIYIDPPYNTGHDFIYNDKFKKNTLNKLNNSGQNDYGKSQSNYESHSQWLSMMYPRLKLARDLLAEDGVIFISIDDNELNNLKLICDEIFGEDNYIALLTVENNPKGRKNSKFISVSCEYCLIYGKNINSSYFIENIPKEAKEMKLDDDGNFVHNSGRRVIVGENYFNKLAANKNSEKYYSVYYNQSLDDLIICKENDINDVRNDLMQKQYKRYISFRDGNFVENTYSINRFKELFDNDCLDFKNDKIYEKNFSTAIRMKNLLVNRKYQGIVNNKIVDVQLDFKTTSAGTYLKNLFDGVLLFPAPKNVNFIKLLLSLFEEKDYYVMDFFAGSASTAQAVLELNAVDNGNRKYIMVQIPEKCPEKSEAFKLGYNTICEIGEERVRRAAKKIKEQTNAEIDYGFQVYKIENSNIE